MDVVKIEVILRVFTIIFLVLACCLVGLDSQTKVIFAVVVKKATFRDVPTYKVLVSVGSAAAAYNLVHIVIKHCFLSKIYKVHHKGAYANMAWMCFLLDQAVAYIVFGVNTGALEFSILAVTGSNIFQWMKVCDKFRSFCDQIGGALFCYYLASIFMVLLSFISAFNLFRLYSTKHISYMTFFFQTSGDN